MPLLKGMLSGFAFGKLLAGLVAAGVLGGGLSWQTFADKGRGKIRKEQLWPRNLIFL